MRRVVVTGLLSRHSAGRRCRDDVEEPDRGQERDRLDHPLRRQRPEGENRGRGEAKDHEWGFDPDKRVDHKVQRQVDPFIVYALDAAGQALEDAGLTDMDEDLKERTGVSIGSGIGGLPGIESESLVLAERGPGRVSPHFVHGRLINLTSGQVHEILVSKARTQAPGRF